MALRFAVLHPGTAHFGSNRDDDFVGGLLENRHYKHVDASTFAEPYRHS